MDAYSEQVLTWMVTYGAPMLAFTLFLGALGSPLPETFFVIAGGAFIRQGVLDVFDTLVLSLISLVVGDYLGFLAGRGAYGSILPTTSVRQGWCPPRTLRGRCCCSTPNAPAWFRSIPRPPIQDACAANCEERLLPMERWSSF